MTPTTRQTTREMTQIKAAAAPVIFPDTLRVLGDFANHHPRQTGIGHELSDHGEGKNPLVFAKFRDTNIVVVGNRYGGRQIDAPRR